MSAELGFFSVLLVARHHVAALDKWKRNCAVDLLCIPPRHSEREFLSIAQERKDLK